MRSFLKDSALKKFIFFAILGFSAFLFYFLVFVQYFEQDEWHTFGIISVLNWDYLFGDRIGARFIFISLFNLFGINPVPFGLLAFVLHISNTFLVYKIANKLVKNSIPAIIASFFFIINELGNEAYTWFAGMNSSATAVFFFLLSLYFFIGFAQEKIGKKAIISFLFLFSSLFFKEIGIYALILDPAIYFAYNKFEYKKILYFLKWNLLLLIYGITTALYYLYSVINIPGDRVNYIAFGNSFIPTLLTHTIQYPFEGVVQTAIPNAILFMLSPITTALFEPNLPKDSLEFLLASQNKYAEITIVFILVALGGTLFFILKNNWERISNTTKTALLVSIAMSALSFLPYIVLNRSFSYFDSRHYYIATVGVSIFLASLMYYLLYRKSKIRNFIFFVLLIGYSIMHISVLYSDIKLLWERAIERKSFLSQVNQILPRLNKKTVFYITGNSEGYYGLPDLKVPFQSGLGHVLMVKYTQEKQLNPNFFRENTLTKMQDVGFLFDILGQGYREVDGQGFGYYYDEKVLNESINQNLFSRNDVTALFYDSETKKLKKI